MFLLKCMINEKISLKIMSDRKKYKRSHHFKNRNYRERDYSNNSENTDQGTSQTNDVDIPGFYYDPVKRKYFRIQANNFGLQSVITNDSIKNKIDNLEFEKKCKLQLKNRNNWINFMYAKELYGIDSSLRIKYNDNILINSKLKNFLTFDSNNKIKKIELFSKDTNYIYVLVNFISIPYSYRILRFQRELIECINDIKESLNEYENLSFIEIHSTGELAGPFFEKQSNLPAYIVNENYIVSNYQSTDTKDHRPYKLKIAEIEQTENLFEEKLKYLKSYQFPLWCSSVNREMSKCAVGLHQGAEANSLLDNFYYKLNTRRSDAFCVKFRPETNEIYAGRKI